MFRIKACEGIYYYLSLKLISSHFYFGLIYSTFNIPDTFNRSFVYTNNNQYIGIYSDGDLPDITGTTFSFRYLNATGAFSQYGNAWSDNYAGGSGWLPNYNIDFYASRCSSIYKSDVDFVRPRCVIIQAAIKY